MPNSRFNKYELAAVLSVYIILSLLIINITVFNVLTLLARAVNNLITYARVACNEVRDLQRWTWKGYKMIRFVVKYRSFHNLFCVRCELRCFFLDCAPLVLMTGETLS